MMGVSIPQRFETIAIQQPERPAVTYAGRVLSYGQLDAASNRVANYLLSLGNPAIRSAVLLLEHGADVIVGILGTLKAGIRCCVLDSKGAEQRLRHIVDDFKSDLILTNSRNCELALRVTDYCRVINMDDGASEGSGGRPKSIITPDQVAYVVYTSGSTGTPRGVARTHETVARNALSFGVFRSIQANDRLSLLHAVGSGSGVADLFSGLLNGAAIVPFNLVSGDIHNLIKWVHEERITILHCTPSIFRDLRHFDFPQSSFPDLRLIRLSGAPITKGDFDLYRHRFPSHVRLEVGMGSTEVESICNAIIDRDFVFPEFGSPVGYAREGKEVLILNDEGVELGPGEVGEIAIRSRQFTNVNMHRFGLPKEQIQCDPKDENALIYRTGDRGVRFADGFVIHRGRKDLVVKIRGFRVDISEVELALLGHPGIQESAVRTWDREEGEEYLAGYIIPRPESVLNTSDVREFLRNKLPDYMIPSAFVFMNAFPLTNGKLDRRALPPPSHARPDLAHPYIAGRTRLEKKLAEIWAEAVNVDTVGVEDDFFDLGGHSLAAAALVTKIKEVFGREFPVSELFQYPTVARMAEFLSRAELRSSKEVFAPDGATQASLEVFGHHAEESVPQRFESMVNKYPDRIAVKAGNRTITYSELNAMANRIAHEIIGARGSHPEPVALLVDKGLEQIAAMLGILKSGKFFVQLPQLPAKALRELLETSGTEMLLVDQSFKSLVGSFDARCQFLRIERISATQAAHNPPRSTCPDALACVVYTSGSTGKPKGVVRDHRALLHGAMLRVQTDGITSNDRLAHITSGTSNAVTNSFYALLQGAMLVIFDAKNEGVSRLARWLEEEKITICLIASPVFRRLCATLNGTERFSFLRYMRLRSDAVYQSDVELHRRYFPETCFLANGLASSETGPLREFRIGRDTQFSSADIPVGYALPDKKVLLIDEQGQEVGFNRLGEIVVRSRYLAVGYWRDAELTAQKFKPDPHDAGSRLFYTGDLGLMLPDGCMFHKGRKDSRVKIRGYGVDVTEVENALRSLEGVREAVVIATGENEDKRLIAYYTTRGMASPTVYELTGHLQKQLADFSIPSAFLKLAEIPLTSNGKIDRAALPQPPKTRPDSVAAYVPPRTPAEERLAAFWVEALGIDRVGINDNFFDLGGHSLAGADIATKIKKYFGIDFPLSELLRMPTVAQLAESVGCDDPPITAVPTDLSAEYSERFPKEDLNRSIPHRFEKIARTFPNHIAIRAGESSVSYSGLNAMANRVARLLIADRGNGSEPVGLLIGNRIAQLAAMLGVFKTGKFVILLDSSFPLERNAAIVSETRLSLILADAETALTANELANGNCKVMRIDPIGPAPDCADFELEISPDALASVVYTSGSTGNPKGVMQTHRSRLHAVMLYSHLLRLTEKDRCMLLTSGTENSVINSLYALLSGATLHCFNVRALGLTNLASYLVDEKVSVCAMSAPLFRNFCEVLTGSEKFPDLRILRLTSEASYKSDFELYKRHFPQSCNLVNMLAPTEAGILRCFLMNHESRIVGDEVPLGYPVDDKEIVLEDEKGQEVGFNRVGEIVVRSDYLALGYWGRPDLNRVKFRDDPNSGQRYYSTGDLGLLRPDGCLIYKGRKDFRVKIRGYGVETPEVEKALRGHPLVKECAVVDFRDTSGESRLIAYYSAKSSVALPIHELRSFLAKGLPSYMIPSMFVAMDALPLTANGKLDRPALPDPDTQRPDLSVSYEAPATAMQQRLVDYWKQVLCIDRVGIHDDFFELGGHSLSGARLVSMIHEGFGAELTVSEFFAAPTIAQLSERIGGACGAKARGGKKLWSYLCELQRGQDRPPVFIFPGGGGGEPEFFVYGLLARHAGTEYPFYGLRARGADGTLQPHKSVSQMADAYVEEIRSIQPKGPYFLVGECAGGVNAYEAARQLRAQGQEVGLLVLMDVERPRPLKYLRYRIHRWLAPLYGLLDSTLGTWCRESYHLTRLLHHARHLRSLRLRDYPRYIAKRIPHTLRAAPQKNSLRAESRQERAEIVLYTTATGAALRHIEKVRENYRRTVRCFRPQPYDGPVDLIVSEKLHRADPSLGWKRLVRGGLSIHPVKGDHWTYTREHVKATGAKLRECLERAEENVNRPHSQMRND